MRLLVPTPSYRRPLARDLECFELAFLLDLFATVRLEGELMMLRTAATRSGLSPRLRPNSSGVGTRFLIVIGTLRV
jgi:hypothetical protein